MEIKFNVLQRQFELYKEEYQEKALEVLNSGWYILGKEVECFEKEFGQYIGSKYCVGVANGLDALILAFRALGIKEGDEVIVQANTYIASVMGITMNGATPIFIEPDEYYNIDTSKIEMAITENTKAVLVVHLYGQACKMDDVVEICNKHKLYLVEDCAQSHGAKYDGQMTGSFGDIGCFSFYPSKNLGAFGDAGCITTDNAQLADKIKVLRNYGSEKRYHNSVVGYNSRLDELQAGLLRVKLSHMEELNKQREEICNQYLKGINNPLLKLPQIRDKATQVWHLFVVYTEDRELFVEYLSKNNIGTVVHYPIPPHLSEAYAYLGHKQGSYPITEAYSQHIVSLPLYNGMTQEEVQYVIDVINKYKGYNTI
ncbi:MAG: DegT/DnrJ/EryC1/StrS family aminotransferase [Cellulosilyticaceae bacterium]